MEWEIRVETFCTALVYNISNFLVAEDFGQCRYQFYDHVSFVCDTIFVDNHMHSSQQNSLEIMKRGIRQDELLSRKAK